VTLSISTQASGRGLHRFAVVTAAATLALVGLGGLVTSHGVGMAVPDWPNTYGYNIFLFPVSQWVGGIFYEHTHRLLASGVGLLTAILVLWLHGRAARPLMRGVGLILVGCGLVAAFGRPGHRADVVVLGFSGLALAGAGCVWPRCEGSTVRLRQLGLAAFGAVVLQGVLGGLRVVLLKDQIGVFHALLAQVFFVMVTAIAFLTSRWWQTKGETERAGMPVLAGPSEDCLREFNRRNSRFDRLRWLAAGCTALILLQLILGATMRHQHAGLAIPDFPLAYGRVWPSMDAAAMVLHNQQRLETVSLNPITALGIALQLAHRLLAVLILGSVAWCAWLARRSCAAGSFPARLGPAWLLLILGQVLLGEWTIWSDKAADVATLHVLVGALALMVGGMLTMAVWSAPGNPVRAGAREPERGGSPIPTGLGICTGSTQS
jgi:heme a synthase